MHVQSVTQRALCLISFYTSSQFSRLGKLRSCRPYTLQVYYLKVHVAETAPFPAPPLDLDENEHASRRISTPLMTMGLISRERPFRLTDLV